MGLFGKKEAKRCPICGGEMTFFSSALVADGEICPDCEKKLRGEVQLEQYWEHKFGHGYKDEDYKLKTYDHLRDLTLDDIRTIFAEKQERREESLEMLGDDYANIFQPEEAFSIEPKPLQVGLKRAKQMKGSCVVRGMAQRGSFDQGDSVLIVHEGEARPATILELVPCGSLDFWTEMAMHKKHIDEGFPAWFVLSPTDGFVEPGDRIVK